MQYMMHNLLLMNFKQQCYKISTQKSYTSLMKIDLMLPIVVLCV